MGYAIGVDLGSQGVTAQLLAPDGGLRDVARAACVLAYPRPGWAEGDAGGWWDALATVVGSLLQRNRLTGSDVTAIAFGSQVDGAVILADDGAVLRPPILWLDRRAEEETASLALQLPASRFRELSGLNVDSSHLAPKLMWLRNHESAAFERATSYHLPGSWIVQRLTGAAVIDYSNASSTLLYDIRSRAWSPELAQAASLDTDRLPELATATTEAGRLTTMVAAELGLSTTCIVAVGCGDEHAAALGAGVLAPGPVCDIAGTAEPVLVAAFEPILDETGLVETHAHADPRCWLVENPGFVSGGSVRWFNDTIARTTYDELTDLAAQVMPGADGVLFVPSLSGAMTPRWNGKAKGTFHGLSLATGIPELARAVFEGCAFAVRDVVDRFAALEMPTDEIRVVGGGSASDLLLQMKADVTHRPVRRLVNAEATSTGACMVAGVAAGTFRDLDEAADALVSLEQACREPSESVAPAYEEAYRAYRALYDAVEPTFARNERQ